MVRNAGNWFPWIAPVPLQAPPCPAARWNGLLILIFCIWTIALFDPHLLLQSYGVPLVGKTPTILYSILGLVVVSRVGQVTRFSWYPPFLMFMFVALIMVPFAENTGNARAYVLKILLPFYVLIVGSGMLVRTVDKAAALVKLYFFQFPWWWLHASGGVVWWHPDLANEDSYGPLMTIGFGYAYYFGIAARRKGLRISAFLVSALCVIGVISSIARGAALSAATVALVMWVRAKRRTAGLVVGIAAALLVLAGAEVLFPGGAYWEEMSTIFADDDRGTKATRAELWEVGWMVFLERPFFGAGAGNFGPYAAERLGAPLELELFGGRENLWSQKLHNIYVQVLCEFGALGSIAMIWVLIDFWRKNRQLRTGPFRRAWAIANRGALDLRGVSLAIEAALIGFLSNGVFYNQLHMHWLYTIIALNLIVHQSTLRYLRKFTAYRRSAAHA